MAERLSAWLPIALLAMLAALTSWLDRIVRPPEAAASANRQEPDYIVEKISALRVGADGRARYRLSAERMVHYPEDDTTLLTAPVFVSYGTKEVPVTITARQGVVSGRGEHLYFQDDVRVTRAARGDRSELVVTTSFLHLIPEQHLARTDRAVQIADASTVVTAEGLELNSETRVLRLLSKVRGTYDPARGRGR